MYVFKLILFVQYDIKNRKMFLRTSVRENNITLSDLYLGNSINICGRLLNVADYGDEYTRRQLSSKKERFVPKDMGMQDARCKTTLLIHCSS